MRESHRKAQKHRRNSLSSHDSLHYTVTSEADHTDYGGDSDLTIFQATKNQIQGRRLAGQNLLRKHPHLGLSFLKTEYEEVEALVNRVAPDLARYLHTHYPDHHHGTIPPKQVAVLPSIPEESPKQHLQRSGNEETTETKDEIEHLDNPERNPPLRIELPPDRLNSYKGKMHQLSNFMVLGYVSGRNPTVGLNTTAGRRRRYRIYSRVQ